MEIKKLDHIALYVADRDAAADFLTSYLGFHVVDRTDRYTLVGAGGRIGKLTLFDGPEGLPLGLVRGAGEFTDYDLEGVVLRSSEPEESARAFLDMGFAPGGDPTTVMAGEYRIALSPTAPGGSGQEMLFHLGCLVDSAQDHRREAEERGMEVQDFVEGPNTLAVFVRGPEDVSVEYVEHKPTFSLT
jgi:catechol 2,3-dioxygenase-like lactoylglutathione lyase family enzyme